MARAKRISEDPSPQAKLARAIKSARDAMRKDAGLNGDLDRIPQLAWLLFLRAFDGLEQNREVTEENFVPRLRLLTDGAIGLQIRMAQQVRAYLAL